MYMFKLSAMDAISRWFAISHLAYIGLSVSLASLFYIDELRSLKMVGMTNL